MGAAVRRGTGGSFELAGGVAGRRRVRWQGRLAEQGKASRRQQREGRYSLEGKTRAEHDAVRPVQQMGCKQSHG